VNVPPPLDRLMNIIKDLRERDLRAAARPGGPVPNQRTKEFFEAYGRALKHGEGTPECEAALAELDTERNAIVNHIQEWARGASSRDQGFAQKVRGALRKISPPAFYSVKRGMGHSGLKIWPYVHFTSPNRRGPDQEVKRLRDAKLTLAPVTYENEVLVGELERKAERANVMMRRIAEAERDAHRIVALHALKTTEVGTEFKGLKISGYAPKGKGIFVSVPLGGGGFHRFTVTWETLIGPGKDPRSEGALRRFRPGETINLRFKEVDFVNREAVFEHVESESLSEAPRERKGAPKVPRQNKGRRGPPKRR